MCLALFKPANTEFDERILTSGFRHNPDGAGFAYAKDGKLTLKKGFFTISSLLKAWRKVPQDAPAIIHLRLASHGGINAHNCHPWQINEDNAMIHNGMFFDFGSRDTSDSGEFTQKILTPLFNSLKDSSEAMKQGWLRYLLSGPIDKWNKVVFLNSKGESLIIREKEGFWYDGIWHSNSGGLDYLTQDEVEGAAVDLSEFDDIVAAQMKKGKDE